MAEENKGQAPEPEQEPVQGEEPAREPEETSQPEEKPAREKGEGLLMPVLYALLAGVGAFTLALILGIVLTYFNQPAGPEENPSGEPSVTASLSPDADETRAPQEPGGQDAGDGENGDDTDAGAADTPE